MHLIYQFWHGRFRHYDKNLEHYKQTKRVIQLIDAWPSGGGQLFLPFLEFSRRNVNIMSKWCRVYRQDWQRLSWIWKKTNKILIIKRWLSMLSDDTIGIGITHREASIRYIMFSALTLLIQTCSILSLRNENYFLYYIHSTFISAGIPQPLK